MSNDIQRSKGTSSNYRFNRGGMPAEFGPFVGVVKNNFDPTRSGRLQVFIEQFAGNNENDASLWRTVSYVSPYYGATPTNQQSTTQGDGTYKGNPQSYGMWFTAPDVGTKVICFFVSGDPNQGYYTGCIVDPGVTQMLPAIGSTENLKVNNNVQQSLLSGAGASRAPVVEINENDPAARENPRFFDLPKPVHSYTFGILANQGLLADPIRGTINSSASRESPSTVFGFSTPGRPIYQGSITDDKVAEAANSNESVEKLNVEGRRGGHSIVMDDGDSVGNNNQIRLRTGKGHQITMSDDGDCFYITHSNGQSWMEFGSEGTVDVFATNSINFRSKGDINFHADRDIALNAVEGVKVKGITGVAIESPKIITALAGEKATFYAKQDIGMASGSTLKLASRTGGITMSGSLKLKGRPVLINSGASAGSPAVPQPLTENQFDDVLFNGTSWATVAGNIQTIATRVTTHEPYPYHNLGVDLSASIETSGSAPVPVQTSAAVTGAVENGTITNRVNEAGILASPGGDVTIGTLSALEVAGMCAERSQRVGQSYTIASPDRGIGEFGFTPEQLESLGFIKPGTVSSLQNISYVPTTTNQQQINNIMIQTGQAAGLNRDDLEVAVTVLDALRNPAVWTGQNGVGSLNNFLQDRNIQNYAQQVLYKNAFGGLVSKGLINGSEAAKDIVGLIAGSADLGVNNVGDFISNIGSGLPETLTKIGTNIVNTSINTAVSGIISNSTFGGLLGGILGGRGAGSIIGAFFSRSFSPAFGTIVRQLVDTAVTNSLNDVKITAPNFSPLVTTPIIRRSWSEILQASSVNLSGKINSMQQVKIEADQLLNESRLLFNSATVSQSEVDALQNKLSAINTQLNTIDIDDVLSDLRNNPANLTAQQQNEIVQLINQNRLVQNTIRAIRTLLNRTQERIDERNRQAALL